ncbi:MAG: helix-turn-helix domain-containing protein [Candidatus Saelkia tenebricola]|nr:helix-turn-helix domain-containing protein [Candidatus Saelkia tenebricola]
MGILLTVEDLGEVLKVSQRTIYDWTHANFIPYYKFPKGVRFKKTEIERWLKQKHQNGRMFHKVNIDEKL